MGGGVLSGARLTVEGPKNDPVRAAYKWYVGHNSSRSSWDPLTTLYASGGLGHIFGYGNDFGYNHVFPNGSNAWVFDQEHISQRWLSLKVDDETAAKMLDQLFLSGAESVQQPTAPPPSDEL